MQQGTLVHRTETAGPAGVADADPITTEVIRHALNSAAEAISRTLVRTAMSTLIYEVLDFAAVLYDRQIRLLAQAPSLPLFMGTMGYCVKSAVEEVGGEGELEPGDIILLNNPYQTGSHQQDAAVVMPIFLPDGELIGYSAIKAHWVDIGAKELYGTDTVDVFQEGVIFPGVKLYSRGEVVKDVMKMATANSRLPKYVAGDINAEVAGVRVGARELVRIVERYGKERFQSSVEQMFDHGEAVIRDYIEKIEDGRYVGHGIMDNDGVTDDEIPFDVTLEVDGSTARVDFSEVPDAQVGPVNCPLPSTVSAARVILTMLAGAGEAPNEGHYRPIEVITREGSMFHPVPPQPCFLYAWPALQATEAVMAAVSTAMPEAVPACSGGDINAVMWYGFREQTGAFWGDGAPSPIGQGASIHGDGQSARLHHIESASRMPPLEAWESKNPWMMERCELATDSGGPGKFRGGLGPDMAFHLLEDAFSIPVIERSKNAPWGLAGGQSARPNSADLRYPDGSVIPVHKQTGLKIPKGSTFTLHCGGGGGYGTPAERDPQAVLDDVKDGYVSEEEARKHYPHAFDA